MEMDLSKFDLEKVSKKFDLKKDQIVDIEILGSEEAGYTLLVWILCPCWNNPSQFEQIDSCHKIMVSELNNLLKKEYQQCYNNTNN